MKWLRRGAWSPIWTERPVPLPIRVEADGYPGGLPEGSARIQSRKTGEKRSKAKPAGARLDSLPLIGQRRLMIGVDHTAGTV